MHSVRSLRFLLMLSFLQVQTYAMPDVISFSPFSYMISMSSDVYLTSSFLNSSPSHSSPTLIPARYSFLSASGFVSSIRSMHLPPYLAA